MLPTNLSIFFLGLLLLCVGCRVSGHCSVPASPTPLVRDLLYHMMDSISPGQTPNPSVLIALRLAREHNLTKEQELLHMLKEDVIMRVRDGKDVSSRCGSHTTYRVLGHSRRHF
nr:PREDICTED: gastric intrinsic factor-like isoform X1 [Latimeria chalumnae]|eukprot:XP_014339418.1 PREDICTED: gastric intrinsic factor-like isoform X1 [Latimeria chalumnae]